jgi:hypothetical protein
MYSRMEDNISKVISMMEKLDKEIDKVIIDYNNRDLFLEIMFTLFIREKNIIL